jgi:hypothetical protein
MFITKAGIITVLKSALVEHLVPVFTKQRQEDAEQIAKTIQGVWEVNHRLTGEVLALRTQIAITQNNFEWARERMNYLEQERGLLFARLLNVETPVPQVMRTHNSTPTVTGLPLEDQTSRNFQVTFEDVGDEQAQQLGIEHDTETGNVVYRR